MVLPLSPPVSPMLAKAVADVPDAPGLVFEPKWDGFRCIVFRDGDDVVLGSRNERPLTRYFPEVVDAVRAALPPRCVVDGEIILVGATDALDFEALQQRIHPAASRVARLAAETPARFVAFDLLALGDDDLTSLPFAERRRRLDDVLGAATGAVCATPATSDRAEALRWFHDLEGAGLDGIVAKAAELTYQPGKRVMLKVKHRRTADCVVAGFRWHKSGGVVGSLLLGLYDADGALHHVGVTASFTAARRKELVDELAAYRMDDLSGHPWAGWGGTDGDAARAPGAPSRWTAKKDLSWEPLRPELVCEVAYDYFQGDRFRHATTFVRWRPDREAASCGYDQAEVPAAFALSALLG